MFKMGLYKKELLYNYELVLRRCVIFFVSYHFSVIWTFLPFVMREIFCYFWHPDVITSPIIWGVDTHLQFWWNDRNFSCNNVRSRVQDGLLSFSYRLQAGLFHDFVQKYSTLVDDNNIHIFMKLAPVFLFSNGVIFGDLQYNRQFLIYDV